MWGHNWGQMIWGGIAPAVPALQATGLLLLAVALLWLGNGGAYISNPSQAFGLLAPVQIPPNAHITEIEITARDNDPMVDLQLSWCTGPYPEPRATLPASSSLSAWCISRSPGA
jgi:hypothetical protein